MMLYRRPRGFVFAPVFAGLMALVAASGDASANLPFDVPQWPSDGVCARLADPVIPGVDDEDRAAVSAFYAARACRPVWIEQGGLTRAATRAVDEIKQAGTWGLDDNDFRLSRLNALLNAGAAPSIAAIADAEFEITGAVLRYARHARGGRIPDPTLQLSTYLDRRPDLPDPATVLAEITINPEPDAALRAYQPSHEQFLRLKELLNAERTKQGETMVLPVPLIGPELRAGIRHPDVVIIKQRLSVASAANDEDLFSDDLVAAVKRLQASRGLKADGVIGKMTRRAFAPPASRGTGTIIANMEAWRWMPETLGNKHAFVNIPSYSLVLYNNGVPEFSERVIVGERETQTPVFSMALRTVVLRPEWYLPDSIKIKKLLGGRSLESQGYVIKKNGRKVDSASINWSKSNFSAYTVSQPSGDDNALGLVKFLFPNKHSVYMHDTPNKSLFNASERMFSHGCVRVRNPLAFAKILLNADKGEGVVDVASLVKKGPHQNEITLDAPVPVHIGYFTVWVGSDGTPFYLNDNYGHEKRIRLALAKQWAKIDKGKDHLAAVDTSALQGIRKPRPAALPPGMGVTTSIFGNSNYQYKRSGGVGDIILRAINN